MSTQTPAREISITANPGFEVLDADSIDSALHAARDNPRQFNLGSRGWIENHLPLYGVAVDEAFARGIRQHKEDTVYAAQSGLLLASRIVANLVHTDAQQLPLVQSNVLSHFPANRFLYGVNDEPDKVRSMFEPNVADSLLKIRSSVACSFCIAGLSVCLFSRSTPTVA